MKWSILKNRWLLVVFALLISTQQLFAQTQLDNPNDFIQRNTSGEIVSVCITNEYLPCYKNSYGVLVIKIADVEFAINECNESLILMSSIQNDDPRIEPVIEYISHFYGTPYEEEPFHFLWPNHIHLRRVYTEDGGTVLIML